MAQEEPVEEVIQVGEQMVLAEVAQRAMLIAHP
jgi:hypothetical protein